jgi:LPS export ABC transporter protein LptC
MRTRPVTRDKRGPSVDRVPFICFLGFLVLLSACRRAAVPRAVVAEPELEPDQTLATFTMDSYARDSRRWSLRAPHADIFDRDHRVELLKPHVLFYSDGRAGSVVTANAGRLNTETNDFWAGNGMVMVSTDGVRLESDWVRYEKSADRFVSTAPVTVTRGRSIVKGVGWEARSDLSEMEIRQQRGEIAPEDHRLMKK